MRPASYRKIVEPYCKYCKHAKREHLYRVLPEEERENSFACNFDKSAPNEITAWIKWFRENQVDAEGTCEEFSGI